MPELTAYNITITGLVQGIGFRPFIFRHAQKHMLRGWVKNTNKNVLIYIVGNQVDTENFIKTLKRNAPKAAIITSVEAEKARVEIEKSFRIINSENLSNEITMVSPDIAVCDECMNDTRLQPHRLQYPLVNCTNCGPRFSIMKNLPYDRTNTTMAGFEMCDTCKSEYVEISDRRFHAQPIACIHCGPTYTLKTKDTQINLINVIIKKTASLINQGEIVVVKGIGGYFIACDALNEEAVKRIREKKFRETKPLAVMFRSINAVMEYALINKEEKKALLSWQRPIVILKQEQKLAQSVALGFNTIGTMLPYMPVHHMLFEKINSPAIVLTSGNFHDEPIVIDNNLAEKQLSAISPHILSYNRDIQNRVDDSVTMVVNHKQRIIRRSRGYAPSPILTTFNTDGILATGAELVNCFCIGKENKAMLSQHIGDLKNPETLAFFEESIDRFSQLFRFKAETVACDLHPDYLSTRYAESLNKPLVKIQHHHAHIASGMTEHSLDEKVIGVSLDGTGLGDDGNTWGSEFLVCDLNNYERICHMDYLPLPGGDSAVKEPWRIAVAALSMSFENTRDWKNLPFLENIEEIKLNMVINNINKNINAPLSCGMGRFFDAVAALTNICASSHFHAEAPMRLENAIKGYTNEHYSFSIDDAKIGWHEMIQEIVDDIKQGIPGNTVSVKFHNTIINIIFKAVEQINKSTGLKKVVLSGGIFQNRFILERTEKILTQRNYQVYSQCSVPSNDGGIALGQLAIAAKRRSM